MMRHVLLLVPVVMLGGCMQLRTDPPPAAYRRGFAYYLESRLPSGPLEACSIGSLGLGSAAARRGRDIRTELVLPDRYRWSASEPFGELYFFPGTGLAPAVALENELGIPPGTALWLDEWMEEGEVRRSWVSFARGWVYTSIGLSGKWEMANLQECLDTAERVPARVLLFDLVHPERDTLRVLTSYWYSSRQGGYVRLLGLGPDEAARAEFVQIGRASRALEARRLGHTGGAM